MDSMRNLHTSLPSTSPPKSAQPPQTPGELFQAFRAAALSVTTLYKTAATDQARARSAGYQDALDDLLAFLDKEHLGLGDGEGWKVRQWATERLDGSPLRRNNDDEGSEEEAEQERQSSPVHEEKEEPVVASVSAEEAAATLTSVPQQTQSLPNLSDIIPPQTDNFTFRSGVQYPEAPVEPLEQQPMNPTVSTPHFRLDVLPRQARHGGRQHSRSSRAAATLNSLGPGAGSKRRVTFGDFFDVSDLNHNSRDGSSRGGGGGGGGGGPKRSRFA